MTSLVVGEALVDLVEDQGSVVPRPGGSPMNVAVGLGRLGMDVVLVTDIGDDDGGRQISAHLASSGVRVLGHREGVTSSARAIIGEDGSAVYDFDIRWNPREPEAFVSPVDAIHVGSMAVFSEPGGSVVRRMFAASDGVKSFDPNIRPELMPDHTRALDTFEAVARHADIVKMSDEDAAWLYPASGPQAVVDELIGRGVPLVALTRGAHGAVVRTANATVEIEPITVTVADTIGAGDSFMAALIEGVTRLVASGTAIHHATPADLAAVGRHAARAAAVTVSRPGANPPWAYEIR